MELSVCQHCRRRRVCQKHIVWRLYFTLCVSCRSLPPSWLEEKLVAALRHVRQ